MKNLAPTLLLLGLISCQSSDNSSPLDPGVSHTVSISLNSQATAKLMDLIIPSAYAAVTSMNVCFKRLRFKTSTDDSLPDTQNDNIDLNIGMIDLNSSASLTSVSVPEGTYQRIEFDLETDCTGMAGKSVQIVNDNGTFNSVSSIKIKFNGTFVVDSNKTVEIRVQNILTAANSVTGSTNLKTALEAVTGTLN